MELKSLLTMICSIIQRKCFNGNMLQEREKYLDKLLRGRLAQLYYTGNWVIFRVRKFVQFSARKQSYQKQKSLQADFYSGQCQMLLKVAGDLAQHLFLITFAFISMPFQTFLHLMTFKFLKCLS